MGSDFQFTSADEAELNDILEGRPAGYPTAWGNRYTSTKIRPGSVGVLWKEPRLSGDVIRPLVLVINTEDQRRLFGRIAQLREHFSPLSAWCHIITPATFEPLDELGREFDLGGTEAAWIGLAISEALLLSERSLGKLKVAACLATRSFAIARTRGLWRRLSTTDILEKYDAAQRLIRLHNPDIRIRSALEPIWATLLATNSFDEAASKEDIRLTVAALKALMDVRGGGYGEEHRVLFDAIEELPEANLLQHLPSMTPENRVREFDRLVARLSEHRGDISRAERNAIHFLAGYLATVAAGGAPSLSLAEDVSALFPEILSWAYAIGGIGEKVLWTSSFDGLGRLVARELLRPFRFDELPTADFAIEEALVLVDRQLSDPFVHLRIKQQRIVTVSLYPGVNIQIPLIESKQEAGRPGYQKEEIQKEMPVAPNETLAILADALWPFLRTKLNRENGGDASSGDSPPTSAKSGRTKTSKKTGSQSKLPLT